MITILGLSGFCLMSFVTIWMTKKYMSNIKLMVKLQIECEKVNKIIPNEKARLAVQCEKQVEKQVEEKVDEIRQNVSEIQVGIIAQALCGQSGKNLQLGMKKLIETTYSRMSQEFVGSLEDETEGLLSDLNYNLCDRIWDSVQQMKLQCDDGPYILPSNVRIAYTKGNRTVVVIEQKPQVRTMGFAGDLVGSKSRNAAKSISDYGYRFTLSFPYVYFFMVFDGTTFKYYEVFFKNKPLTSTREHVYTPPIPNIHRGKNNRRPVCMGNGFLQSVREEGTIAKQCEEVVSEFWQRPFNGHLGNGMNDNTDKRLKNYKRWQEETEKDAMFILDVKWGKGKTVKSVIDHMFKMRNMNHPGDDIDKKIRSMLENGVKSINETVKNAIDSANKNNTLRAGDLDNVVKEQLEEVVVSHTKKVFEHCIRI